jgi:hypothetical protein
MHPALLQCQGLVGDAGGLAVDAPLTLIQNASHASANEL